MPRLAVEPQLPEDLQHLQGVAELECWPRSAPLCRPPPLPYPLLERRSYARSTRSLSSQPCSAHLRVLPDLRIETHRGIGFRAAVATTTAQTAQADTGIMMLSRREGSTGRWWCGQGLCSRGPEPSQLLSITEALPRVALVLPAPCTTVASHQAPSHQTSTCSPDWRTPPRFATWPQIVPSSQGCWQWQRHTGSLDGGMDGCMDGRGDGWMDGPVGQGGGQGGVRHGGNILCENFVFVLCSRDDDA